MNFLFLEREPNVALPSPGHILKSGAGEEPDGLSLSALTMQQQTSKYGSNWGFSLNVLKAEKMICFQKLHLCQV